MRKRNWALALAVVVSSFVVSGAEAQQSDALSAGFANPPDTARPHTWWHWMNGNVSKEGITLDLEAMKRVGIGGAHIAEVGTGIPKGPVAYDSPQRVELIRHAFREADRLGLDLCMFNCPGWSSSGGPWVTPADSMKVLALTETQVVGGQKFNGRLPQPTATQDFYHDAYVIAYPTPAAQVRIEGYDNGLGPGAVGVGGAAAARERRRSPPTQRRSTPRRCLI